MRSDPPRTAALYIRKSVCVICRYADMHFVVVYTLHGSDSCAQRPVLFVRGRLG